MAQLERAGDGELDEAEISEMFDTLDEDGTGRLTQHNLRVGLEKAHLLDALDESATRRRTQQDLRAGLEKAHIYSNVSSLPVLTYSCNIAIASAAQNTARGSDDTVVCVAADVSTLCHVSKMRNKIVATLLPQRIRATSGQAHIGRAQSTQSSGQYLRSSMRSGRGSISTTIVRYATACCA